MIKLSHYHTVILQTNLLLHISYILILDLVSILEQIIQIFQRQKNASHSEKSNSEGNLRLYGKGKKSQYHITHPTFIFSQGEDQGIKILLIENSITHWKGFINGPDDTPYQGGYFQIDIQLPPEYPYKPPKMKFDTRIWHPNISSQTGAICLDVLKDEWSPALSIRTALLSLQALLCDPQPELRQSLGCCSSQSIQKQQRRIHKECQPILGNGHQSMPLKVNRKKRYRIQQQWDLMRKKAKKPYYVLDGMRNKQLIIQLVNEYQIQSKQNELRQYSLYLIAKLGQKLESEITEKLIHSKLIFKDQQLKIIIRKYCDLLYEPIQEDKLNAQIEEFQQELQGYQFQIAKATRQFEASKFDRLLNQDLSQKIQKKTKRTSEEIKQLRKEYEQESEMKGNRDSYETISNEIMKYDDQKIIKKKIEDICEEIDKLNDKHKANMKTIKLKEKQLSMMLTLMKDLIQE